MTYRLSTLILFLIFSCSPQKKEEPKTEAITPKPVAKEKQDQENTDALKPVALFRSIELLQGRVQLELPKQLGSMGEEMFRLKYPAEHQATSAFSDEDATVNFLISPRAEKAAQQDLPKYLQMYRESFASNPNVDFTKSELKKINGRDFIVIEMVTPAVDTEVYNLMFVTSSGGRLLMGTFNCTVDKQKEWQPLAERILGSVKVRD